MRFDLLISGGTVIDPASDLAGRRDVAVLDGRVAAVEPSIPVEAAARLVDASGCLVTPGLIDLHTHVFPGVGPYGVDADAIGRLSGVTTWADAGSAGAYTFPGFRDFVIDRATVRILAFINISYLGLGGLNYDEYANIEACDVPLAGRVIDRHRDVIVGIKTRMGTGPVGDAGIEPLRRAVALGESSGLPVMVHISQAPPPIDDVLALMRPGDILTHAFTGLSERLVDDGGGVRPAARRARDAGIVFDVGHGSGSFSFASAEILTAGGIWPDVISSDLHQMSAHGPNRIAGEPDATITDVAGDGSPAFTLLSVMSKFLHLGMPLEEVVAATTAAPAAVLRRAGEIGSLRPGAIADIAVLRLADGAFPLIDVHGESRTAIRQLEYVRTIVAGLPLDPLPVPPPQPWIRLVDLEVDP
jgi:dihydroorotase